MNTKPQARDDTTGIAFAGVSYLFWGFMPLYWALLSAVPPFELTIHRLLWCAVFVGLLSVLRGRIAQLVQIVSSPRLLGTLALTGILISINWSVFIYCVSSHQLVEASLGYYINPLVSIALGVLLFGEHISRLRLAAIALATLAVLTKAFALGHVPWIAPVLALSFGFYGYFRKLTPVDSLDGLTIETMILLPITLGLVVYWGLSGTGAFPSHNLSRDALLIGGGPLTAVPLALFAAGARRIRLSTLGFLQYLMPTITLLLATFGLGETFTKLDLMIFGLVWLSLVIVGLDGRFSRVKEPISNPEPA